MSPHSSRQAHPFHLNLSDAEYSLIERAARAWNLSITEFLVEVALDKAIAITEEDVSSHLATVTSDEIHPHPEPPPLAEAIANQPQNGGESSR